MANIRAGTSVIMFDASSNLIAARLEDSPSTVWVWDLQSAELRAVLLFHSAVDFIWHPHIRELLLITCLDEGHKSTCFIWDPLTEGPLPYDTDKLLPQSRPTSKYSIEWLPIAAEFGAALFFSNSQHFVLMALQEAGDEQPPWRTAQQSPVSWLLGSDIRSNGAMEDTRNVSGLLFDDSNVDDTFSFKNDRSGT